MCLFAGLLRARLELRKQVLWMVLFQYTTKADSDFSPCNRFSLKFIAYNYREKELAKDDQAKERVFYSRPTRDTTQFCIFLIIFLFFFPAMIV